MLTVLVASLALVAAGCDWPMFRFGADRSGFSPDISISKDAVSSSMVLDYTATTGMPNRSSPAVVNGVVYVGSDRLYAFDAAGTTNCSGGPKSCAPLWASAATGNGLFSSPTVGNGVVYVLSGSTLYAFDAAGTASCSGSPKVCAPLWTAMSGNGWLSSPAVANGVVYVGSDVTLSAFDAAGTASCSGSPKICAPLWTAASSCCGELAGLTSSPAVVNGFVYVGSLDSKLYVFDAAGTASCSGSPKTCAPLWTAATGNGIFSSPAVAHGVVYVGSVDHKFYAFDAAGSANCSGSPKTCAPLWTATTGNSVESSAAVANGVVYVRSDDHKLYAFDAAGTANCSGMPKKCSPLWTATSGGSPGGQELSSPAVANGVVYVGSEDHKLYALDAAGTMSCSGSPKTCAPLWTATTGNSVESSAAVANGVVYVGSDDHKLYAFGLEKIPPTTSVLIPSNRATLSGTALLDASASDNVKVTGLEYHLTGGGFQDTRIGVATPARDGWIFNWNTSSIPNGGYTLKSVASDAAGNIGRSANVSITVRN